MSERRRRRAARLWTTDGRLRKLVLMCWALLLIVSITAVGSIQLQAETVRQLTVIKGPARNANEEVRQAMTDAQIGLHGYQLSGDRALLQPYFGTYGRTMTALATLENKLALGADAGDAAELADLGRRQRLASEQWWADALRIEKALTRGERTDLYQSRALFGRFLGVNSLLGEDLSTALDKSRLAAQDLESRGRLVTISIALMALVAMLILGRRLAGTISQPLTELRDTLVRQRQGEPGARAREDQGSSELRSVASDFNALTDKNLGLLQTQERALKLKELTFGIARAIRTASDTQQALDIACAELGNGLVVDRVIASTFDAEDTRLLSAQWHRPDLPLMADLSAELFVHLARVAEDVWLAEGFLVRSDFLSPEVQSRERSRIFHRETGARAVIMAPIGLGDRVIGMIYVIAVHQSREWTESEARAVQQVAGFAARAIVQADERVHQSKYVERLEELDRQKSDFLATVSHELRTPLTSISGYLELLQEGDVGELTGQQLHMLEIIDRNTVRLRSLIEDVMVLSRIEGGVTKINFVAVSIHALITRVSQELWLTAQKNGIELEVDAGPETAVVLGDKATLDRAVVNLLSNAIKFSRPGGIVTISASLEQDTRRVLIACQDRGVGIPARDQADLFTRFFRASNAMTQAIPGTGLGLSIVKQIVEDHGGKMRLTSVEDEGTTVVMYLALYEPSEDEQAQETVGNGSHSDDVLDIRA